MIELVELSEDLHSKFLPFDWKSSRHLHTESYTSDILIRHLTFSCKEWSTSELLLDGSALTAFLWAGPGPILHI